MDLLPLDREIDEYGLIEVCSTEDEARFASELFRYYLDIEFAVFVDRVVDPDGLWADQLGHWNDATASLAFAQQVRHIVNCIRFTGPWAHEAFEMCRRIAGQFLLEVLLSEHQQGNPPASNWAPDIKRIYTDIIQLMDDVRYENGVVLYHNTAA